MTYVYNIPCISTAIKQKYLQLARGEYKKLGYHEKRVHDISFKADGSVCLHYLGPAKNPLIISDHGVWSNGGATDYNSFHNDEGINDIMYLNAGLRSKDCPEKKTITYLDGSIREEEIHKSIIAASKYRPCFIRGNTKDVKNNTIEEFIDFDFGALKIAPQEIKEVKVTLENELFRADELFVLYKSALRYANDNSAVQGVDNIREHHTTSLQNVIGKDVADSAPVFSGNVRSGGITAAGLTQGTAVECDNI